MIEVEASLRIQLPKPLQRAPRPDPRRASEHDNSFVQPLQVPLPYHFEAGRTKPH